MKRENKDGEKEKALYEMYGRYKRTRTTLRFLPLDGSFQKRECCVIIPYRDSKEQPRAHMLAAVLRLFANARIPVVVAEQADDGRKFNRGAMLNVGYLCARMMRRFDVFVFNDVDLLPDARLLHYYGAYAADAPVHMAGPRQQHKYPYQDIYGGIISMTGDQFERINGYPNSFWGWGGEDDAMYNRVAKTFGKTYRPVDGFAHEMRHSKTDEIPGMVNAEKRDNILRDLAAWQRDGVNSAAFFQRTSLTPVDRGEWYVRVRADLPRGGI